MVRSGPWILPGEVIDPPLIPNALDDEFDLAGGLNAAWVKTGTFDLVTPIDAYANFAGVTGARIDHNSIRPSWLLVQCPANSAVPNIYKVVAPPTNAFYWVRGGFTFRNASAPVNDSQWGFGLYDATFANGVTIKLNEAGTVNQIRAGFFGITASALTSSFLTTMDGAVGAQAGVFYHGVGIQKRGTTYDGWLLSTSGTWQWLGSIVHATAFTKAPIYFSNSVTTAPGCGIVGIDFFRVRDGIGLP